jgi:hypothetical protein
MAHNWIACRAFLWHPQVVIIIIITSGTWTHQIPEFIGNWTHHKQSVTRISLSLSLSFYSS